jgi:WD40 repeat protein
MFIITQKLLLSLMVIAVPVYAQLPCCQIEQILGNPGVGNSPSAVAYSPDGRCLAVANELDNTVSIFRVNSDCTVEAVGEAVSSGGVNPRSLSFSPDGCLAVGNAGTLVGVGRGLSIFTVDAECTLTPLITGFDVGDRIMQLAYSPDGRCLAIIGSSQVIVYPVNPGGCLLIPNPGTFGPTLFGTALAYSPDGRCIAVAGGASIPTFPDFILTLSVNGCIQLTQATRFEGIFYRKLAFSPDGRCLAAIASDIGEVHVYTVNDDCTFNIPAASFEPGGVNPVAVAYSSDGSCLAVVNRGSDEVPGNVVIFAVTGCSLTPMQVIPLPTGASPSSVAYSPNGCLAVANSGSSDISVFRPLTVPQPTITSALVTNCNIVTVTGTAVPDATVTLFADGDPTPIGSGSADNVGNFTIETTPLSGGTHSITAVTTLDGCTSSPSNAVTVTITSSITITAAFITCGNILIVIGRSTPNASVTLAIDNQIIATRTANNNGLFVFAGITVPSGMHCVTATDTASGCQSAPVCLSITPLSCILAAPNLAFGTHCCNRL